MIDLQALATELEAAGAVGRVDGNHIEFDDLTHALIDVWDNGEVTVGSDELKVDLRILAIIARHLGHAPAAPVPAITAEDVDQIVRDEAYAALMVETREDCVQLVRDVLSHPVLASRGLRVEEG